MWYRRVFGRDTELNKVFHAEKHVKAGDENTEQFISIRDRLAAFASKNLFGADFDPFLVRAAQMNVMMAGNGLGHLFHMNSLEFPVGHLSGVKPANEAIPLGSIDVVATNPPFGSDIPVTERSILEQYELARRWERQGHNFVMTQAIKPAVAPEILFIERCVQWLKPGGRMGIVLPDGVFITQPGDPIRDALLPWWKAGFQIHVHSNGNGGNDSTLDALAALQAAQPRVDHRFTIQHFGSTAPEMARRLRALGGVASVNPYYVHYRGEFNAPMVGADRANTAARLKTLLDAGNVVSLHSDTPVGPPRPLEWAWIAVHRLSLSGQVLAPAERVSVMQAMKMITIDAAYTLGVEDRIGSIQAGKLADFTVLEQDPFTVAPMKLKDIRVWGTVLGGRLQPVSDIKPEPSLASAPVAQ